MRPFEAIAGPLGSSELPLMLQGSPPVPCHTPQLTLPAGSFKCMSSKGSGKFYFCEWCEKQTSNQDFMVSHCLQEHLGIFLACPHCGMSYTDPSKFCLHGRGSITCCSIRPFQFPLPYNIFLTFEILKYLKQFVLGPQTL